MVWHGFLLDVCWVVWNPPNRRKAWEGRQIIFTKLLCPSCFSLELVVDLVTRLSR